MGRSSAIKNFKLLAYHSTSKAKADQILERGFRLPTSTADSRTDSRVGVFYPAIFFARDIKNALYGEVVLKVEISGKFMRWLPPKPGESLADRLTRSLKVAKTKGFDGVDPEYDTVGVAVINPAAVTVTGVAIR